MLLLLHIYITMDELLNPETDERLVLYVCRTPVRHARGSIGGSALFLISNRKKKTRKRKFKVAHCWSCYNVCGPQEIIARAACSSPPI